MRLAKIALALLSLGIASSGACLAQSHDVSRPNVVVLISDDQGFAEYGFMGHDII